MELRLSDLITNLKREIEELKSTGPAMFTVDGVELELKFVVEKSTDAAGTVKWMLFAAEAKGTYKTQNVNTVRLTLKPIRPMPAFPG